MSCDLHEISKLRDFVSSPGHVIFARSPGNVVEGGGGGYLNFSRNVEQNVICRRWGQALSLSLDFSQPDIQS